MKRLILIGNGFDLAHGLKTGYDDFLLWYLKRAFDAGCREPYFEDELLSIRPNFSTDYYSTYGRGPLGGSIDELIDHHYENGFSDLITNNYLNLQGKTWYSPFLVKVNSAFFEHLLLNSGPSKWVDIENEYYAHLKTILKDDGDKEVRLEKLNAELKNLVVLLAEYLETLPKPEPLPGYRKLFDTLILKDDIVTVKLKENIGPEEMLVLNFNYTSTVANYFQQTELNYIHGQLGAAHNPLIFGFGDELDEDYHKIENENIREFLTYIKSFWYFKTSNYHNLIRFIESDDFQVYVLGHSCGLSDRTMLKMIFEHDNCKSIKIFYHKTQAHYTALTQQISLHFTDKGVMRKKIVPFDKSSPMPQADSLPV